MTPVPADQPIPYADFARPKLIENPKLNPAGTFMAGVSRNELLDHIVIVQDLATGTTKETDRGFDAFDWFDDTHLLVGNPWKGVVTVDRPGFLLPAATVLPSGKRGLIPGTGFYSDWPESHPPFISGEGAVMHTWGNIEDGTPAFIQTVDRDGVMHLFRKERGHWVDTHVDLDETVPVAIGAAPGEMIVISPAAPGVPRALQRLDTITGKRGELLYRDAKYDCAPRVFLSHTTMEVVGVSVPTTGPRTVWFDEDLRKVQQVADAHFPSLSPLVLSWNVAKTRFLIGASSDRFNDSYYLFDRDNGEFRLIENTAPWFDPERMSPTRAFEYKARDGVSIDGFLTVPSGASKDHPLPAVVMLHWGPWDRRFNLDFNRKVQFFASRGYAVFQPNYRGSEGYDSRFPTADRFDFQKMANDVADGARAIAATGLVDPKREAVLGVDFGAYLAMCVATDEPDLFRCAILYDGVYDWDRLFHEQDSASMFKDAWIKRRLEEFQMTPPSPMKRKDRIKTPLFLTRDVDSSTPALESQMFDFYRTMRRRVPCELLADPNIDNGSDAFDDEVERLGRFEKFLAKYCPAN